jgi:pentapeptide MXKDX repeat protein
MAMMPNKEHKMKRIGTAALAVGITLALATVAGAQTGRDTPQSGTGMDSKDSMSQKGGSMDKGNMQNDNMQKNNVQNDSMQKGNMEKGSTGTMSK